MLSYGMHFHEVIAAETVKVISHVYGDVLSRVEMIDNLGNARVRYGGHADVTGWSEDCEGREGGKDRGRVIHGDRL